jgi:hypothetical protein
MARCFSDKQHWKRLIAFVAGVGVARDCSPNRLRNEVVVPWVRKILSNSNASAR